MIGLITFVKNEKKSLWNFSYPSIDFCKSNQKTIRRKKKSPEDRQEIINQALLFGKKKVLRRTQGSLNGFCSFFFSAQNGISHVKATFDHRSNLENWKIGPILAQQRSASSFFPSKIQIFVTYRLEYMALWYIAASLTLIAILLALASAFSLICVVCFRHQNNRGTMICDYCKYIIPRYLSINYSGGSNVFTVY